MTRDINVRPDPINKILVEQGRVYDPKSNKTKDLNSLFKQPFIHQLEFQIPLVPKNKIYDSEFGLETPQEIEEILSELKRIKPKYYKIDLKLIDFLRPGENPKGYHNILSYYIRSGKVTALSYNTRIDCEDVFSIDTEGNLLMNLTKETYECLGITGKQLKIRGKLIDRYLIHFNLMSASMNQDTKIYERALWCFSNTHTSPITFLMAFTDKETGEDLDVSRLLKELDQDEAKSLICEPLFEPIWNQPILLPTKITESTSVDLLFEKVNDLVEWSGMLSNGILQTSVKTKQELNITYSEPSLNGEVARIQWRGLLSAHHVESITTYYQKLISNLFNSPSQTILAPFAAMILWGFEDSPISWSQGNNFDNLHLNHHSFHLTGDNITSVYSFPNEENVPYVIAKMSSPNDSLFG